MLSSNKFSTSDRKGSSCSAGEVGFAPIILLVAVFGIAAVIAVSGLQASSHLNNSRVQGVYLARGGDDSSSKDAKGSDSSDGSTSGSSGSSAETTTVKSDDSKKSEDSKPASAIQQVIQPIIRRVEDKNQEEKKESEVKENKVKNETEIDKKVDEIETEIENDVNKLTSGEVEFESKDGKLQLKIKDASGSAITTAKSLASLFTQQNLQNLSLKANKGRAKIILKTENGKLKIESDGEDATSNFPISVNQATGQLSVTTPNGSQEIKVLPGQVAQIAQTAGVQNVIQGMEIAENSNQNSPDKMVFKIQGVKTGSLFGLIPISMPVESEVGTETGSILNINQPLILTLLGRFVK